MSLARSTLRVLVVDGHPLVRTGIRSALQDQFEDLRIEEAGSASEALTAVAAHQPHLVLLDVNLPGTHGLDLARQIRAVDPQIKLLIVAAEMDPWTVSAALKAGAAGFVDKRNSSHALPEAIRVVMDGGVFLGPDAQAALVRAEQRRVAGSEPPSPAILSTREREVLRYLVCGDNTKTIASHMQISPKTVETHRQHIMRKLETNSVAVLVHYAIRHGLTRP